VIVGLLVIILPETSLSSILVSEGCVHQWWHYLRKLRQTLSEGKLVGELMRLLREGKGEEHRRLLRLRRTMVWEEAGGQMNFWTTWRRRGKAKAQEVVVVGSGAVEKNIELLIGRRFEEEGDELESGGG
jgi:hypothetical protein